MVKAPDSALDRLEVSLGRLLQTCVFSSATCLFVGLLVWLTTSAGAPAPRSLGEGGQGLLTAGLMILMATPLLRVLVSLVAYARMRDWFFVGTTLGVLALLALTLWLAWLEASAG